MVDPAKEVETPIEQQVPQQSTVMTSSNEAASYTQIQDEVSVTDGFHYIEELPSKYKLYPEETKIYARPLKVLEIKTLSTINDNNINTVVNSVLKKATKGFPIEEMLVADKLYLIFWLRANTYKDSGYVVDFDCTLCEDESTYQFEIDNLDVEEIKPDYDPNKEVILKQSQTRIKWKQLRVKDENTVKDFAMKHRNSMMKFDDELLSVANLITEINGSPKTMLEKYNFLVNLNPIDHAYLESYIRKYELGINPIMNVRCEKCGGISPVAISFRRAFFVPRAIID